ncbi:hypothetical protein T09_12479 [Trichinella sp. T9]|nr:hypothetical protein T09_12479 [Trichinella sp. T9]
MLALTVNSGSKMLGPSTNKMFLHNFILFLITTAVCYQVAVTWALDNTALGKNGVLYDKQNQTETMTKNISNQYLPKENDQNNNKINVKETVFETSIEKENITEFVIKAPLTPITLTPQTMTPIPTNFSEKVEPTNNRSKEHTDEILNMVNAGKTNGSGVELIETLPPNSINHEEFYGNKTVSEISTVKKSDVEESIQKFNQITPQLKMLMENVMNMVNGSKTYGNDNVSEKLKAGKTNGSGVELTETVPPNSINHEEFYGNKTVSEISTVKKSDVEESIQKFNQSTEKIYTVPTEKTTFTNSLQSLIKFSATSNTSVENANGKCK